MENTPLKVGIIGLGYAGLPITLLFTDKYQVTGYDLSSSRINALKNGIDTGGDFEEEEIRSALQKGLILTNDLEALKECNFYIVILPTPVDQNHKPDLNLLIKGCHTIGKVLSKNNIVVFESTVYPGTTEEICVPEIENASGLKYNEDFFVGYSPERINPGDKAHTIRNTVKITSGSTPESARIIDQAYSSVLKNGTWPAPSIKVAESAKILENIQRDVNIALMNETAQIFDKLGIDTNDVINAAATKWNFIPFRPGLVGGHCIGVDPYYMIEKAHEVGCQPKLMTCAREINESIGTYIADTATQLIAENNPKAKDPEILILGFTFKENCPDIRNTKVADIYRELKATHAQITLYDPIADPQKVKTEYGINLTTDKNKALKKQYDAIILCVCHTEFAAIDYQSLKKPLGIMYDVKSKIDKRFSDYRF